MVYIFVSVVLIWCWWWGCWDDDASKASRWRHPQVFDGERGGFEREWLCCVHVKVFHHDFGSSHFVHFGVATGVASSATTTFDASLCSCFHLAASLSLGFFTFHDSQHGCTCFLMCNNILCSLFQDLWMLVQKNNNKQWKYYMYVLRGTLFLSWVFYTSLIIYHCLVHISSDYIYILNFSTILTKWRVG